MMNNFDKLLTKVRVRMIENGYYRRTGQLAEELGVSPQTLSMALTGYRQTQRYSEILTAIIGKFDTAS